MPLFASLLRSCISLFLVMVLTASVSAAESDLPRTEFGQPNMQGIWYYGSATPMERPVELEDQQSYSQQEGEQLMAQLRAASEISNAPVSKDRGAPAAGLAIAQEADHNFASFRSNLTEIEGLYRTSQIIGPANGRYPYRKDYQDYVQRLVFDGHGLFDGPEIRSVSERCAGPTAGPMPPMTGWFYNANMQIVQTQDYVMIMGELTHDARIIPLDSPLAESASAHWMGRSVARWEGDTLIVETAHFRPEHSWWYLRMSGELKVTESFELINDNEILYRFTLNDPAIYTEPVTVEKNIVRRAPGEHIYEYACHEGNYSLPSILAGARRQEADAAAR
ncbi:MAG: hypothetical protein ACJAY7_001434 [Pseudohongiellaceae bacterium]|jgi:hypothetical protein